ncbi:MAG: MotA/TolQ/ExbB proton channel family protein [Salinivirgaceae bacterium]|nr:MotA/TolQ/ExbB proton channel family protein [Salinivirgaceae bacterium]
MNKDFWKSFTSTFSMLVIPVAFIASVLIFMFVFGNPANFQGGDPHNQPLPNNYYGVIYKGGFIVPIIMTTLITVLIFFIERFLTIRKAAGKGKVVTFMSQIKGLLDENNTSEAKSVCDAQKGAVASVVRSGLDKYEEMEASKEMNKDQKVAAIQKEVEEATSLELPGLEQNLVILATISSVATLLGLLGTVLGMIRAFSAMANAGAPDSVALATGISEALINTAFGIGTSALAIIFYNFFTTKIDKITYSIDEAGFMLVQSFSANHK